MATYAPELATITLDIDRTRDGVYGHQQLLLLNVTLKAHAQPLRRGIGPLPAQCTEAPRPPGAGGRPTLSGAVKQAKPARIDFPEALIDK